MTFEVIVLGANGTFPTADGAATGFLLRSDRCNLWLDAGTGTFSNLQKHISTTDIDAVVVSHLHVDHFLDVYPLYYSLRYSLDSAGPTGLEVFGPMGMEEHLGKLLSNNGGEHCDFSGYLRFRTIDGTDLDIKGLSFSFFRTLHPVETFAMRITHGGRTLAYTADSGPTEVLKDVARGADLLIAEASLQDPVTDLKEIHMTAREAGQLAAEAGVGRLILTHISPGLDPASSISQAAENFDGEILVAEDHLTLQV